MDERCRNILVGSILGDGNLTPVSKRKGESQLHVSYHSKFLSYLKWMHNELASLGVNPIRPKKGYEQYQFYTKPSKDLGKLRQTFYPHGKKIVPISIRKLLCDPLSLAVWYMDDGSLDNRARYHFNSSFATYNFSQDNCERLRETLLRNFGIQATIQKSRMRGKVYLRLYILAESMERFITLVAPHILPCFAYKISKEGQQQRSYGGPKRYPVLLGVKSA